MEPTRITSILEMGNSAKIPQIQGGSARIYKLGGSDYNRERTGKPTLLNPPTGVDWLGQESSGARRLACRYGLGRGCEPCSLQRHHHNQTAFVLGRKKTKFVAADPSGPHSVTGD